MIALESTLDFVLPSELEAHAPPEARGLRADEVRLLVSKGDGSKVAHATFTDLPSFLRPGDLLVANDSATLPAALTVVRPGAGPFALHLSTRLSDHIWVVEPRHAAVDIGEVLPLPGGGSATVLAPYSSSARLWEARLDLPSPVFDYLREWGLPISYKHAPGRWPLRFYQTVYAREPGSAEMPSAGRPFSFRVFDSLVAMGVGFVTLTLHAGVSSLEDHEAPFPERYSVPAGTANAVNAAKAAGRRVIAVGTTVVRALETVADEDGRVVAGRGWTDLGITPGRGVKVFDGLLTGFHEPKSSHLLMLRAIAGVAHIDRSYRAALEGRYLWHEFGDSHLILP